MTSAHLWLIAWGLLVITLGVKAPMVLVIATVVIFIWVSKQ